MDLLSLMAALNLLVLLGAFNSSVDLGLSTRNLNCLLLSSSRNTADDSVASDDYAACCLNLLDCNRDSAVAHSDWISWNQSNGSSGVSVASSYWSSGDLSVNDGAGWLRSEDGWSGNQRSTLDDSGSAVRDSHWLNRRVDDSCGWLGREDSWTSDQRGTLDDSGGAVRDSYWLRSLRYSHWGSRDNSLTAYNSLGDRNLRSRGVGR